MQRAQGEALKRPDIRFQFAAVFTFLLNSCHALLRDIMLYLHLRADAVNNEN